MDSPRIQPAGDPAALARASSSLLIAADTILEQMRPALKPQAREGIDAVLANGGTLCIEASTDIVGATRVTLTVVTVEGTRHEVSSVSAADRPSAR